MVLEDKAAREEARRQAEEEQKKLDEAKRRIEIERKRLEEERRKLAAATPPAKPSGAAKPKPAVGLRFAPGDTFKDCAECPELVVIPPGSFMMGSPPNENERDGDEGPQHRVNIRHNLAVGKFEVTQAEWRYVMGNNPSNFKYNRNPVEKVSWVDAQAYLRKLSQITGKRYRLLSEAEWEYVARAGTATPFHTGDQITTSQANFDGDYTYNGSAKGQDRNTTISIGGFRPNRFGVYDMHGNASEWVGDCWNNSYHSTPSDGSVWTHGDCTKRVLRGGSWFVKPRSLRSANRDRSATTGRGDNVGFRVARDLEPQGERAKAQSPVKKVAAVSPPKKPAKQGWEKLDGKWRGERDSCTRVGSISTWFYKIEADFRGGNVDVWMLMRSSYVTDVIRKFEARLDSTGEFSVTENRFIVDVEGHIADNQQNYFFTVDGCNIQLTRSE